MLHVQKKSVGLQVKQPTGAVLAPEASAPVAGDWGSVWRVGRLWRKGPPGEGSLRRNSSARRKGRPAMTPSPSSRGAGADDVQSYTE